jgi:two-component system, sensor histidine kinase PdtaS
MNSVVQQCEDLTEEDIAFLERIGAGLGILADLSRADVLLYCLCSPERAVVVAQARPHSILPIYHEPIVGQQIGPSTEPAVMRALRERRKATTEVRRDTGNHRSVAKGAPVVQDAYPLRAGNGRVVGAICVETNLIERERHQRRSRVFRRALRQFQAAAMAGILPGIERLSPFSEQDGVIVIDPQHRIQYVSGIATNLYRKLGYAGNLLKRRIEDLELDDHSLTLEAMAKRECLEQEIQVGGLVWVKKAIPFYSPGHGLRRLLPRGDGAWRFEGLLLTIHDRTDTQRQEEELRVKVAMIQEIHHRVKNNMQTIASLLRLQLRRADSEEVRRTLQESINRILSVAVIHEFLAHQEARVINIRDVSQRIVSQIREGVLDGERSIHLDLKGPQHLFANPAGYRMRPGDQ